MSNRHVRRVRALLCTIAMTTLVLGFGVTPSPANAGAARTWHVLAGSQSPDMAIQGTQFLPGEIWIDAGDSVTWTANSAEPHTVTFLAGDANLDPSYQFQIPQDGFAVGGSSYDGTSYYNSGVLTTLPDGSFPFPFPLLKSYTLTFPMTGDFVYYCLFHGVMMKGMVHVRPAGTAYPFTQAQYDRKANTEANTIRADGNHLRAQLYAMADRHTVLAGGMGDGMAMVMRFVHQKLTIHAGDTVTFTNPSEAPHTVTFGEEPPPDQLFNYVPSTTYTGGAFSSFIPPFGSADVKVTFPNPGTYHYICAIHDAMGMVGDIVVVP
jgi:plastocyanin